MVEFQKKLLGKINSTIRKASGLKQWRNTGAVIDWFVKIKNKKSQKFIKFDVVNFYPSITEKLLKDAINWARQFVDISKEEEDIILNAKRSILYNDETPWIKKGESDFDVAQGSYDGAESCELVGLFLLTELSEIDRLNVGIYRDDGMAVTHASPRQTDIMKKKN